ncbi:MAG: D-aminoacylase [Candidatus Eremiobacteraeota bacterium]|nr:D-aminoacylase [Candidatus Eremiobacteraeota bacterium]
MKLDISLVGGMVHDGEGNPPVRADLGIKSDRLVYPINEAEKKKARRIIDIEGLHVSPGFINIHGHSDIPFLIDGRVPSVLCQGITTEVVGNCGMSAAPMLGRYGEEAKKALKRDSDVLVDWEDFNGFFSRLMKNGIAINMITLIGQGNLRGSVVGLDDRPATPDEMGRMKELVVRLMKQGAWGISTGLIYTPSVFANTEELINLVGVLRETGGYYSTHIRGEGSTLIDAIQEALTIAENAHVPVEISHLKAAGVKNWGKIDRVLEMIRSARSRGVFVQHDQYPYEMSSTGLSMVLPLWALDGGGEKAIERIKNPETRAKIIDELKNDPYAQGDRIIISGVGSEKNRKYLGRRVDNLAKEEKKDVGEFILDLLLEEKGSVGAIYLSMCEEDVRKVMLDPYTAVCTDADARAAGGPLNRDNPHPRAYGSFPRVIGHYSRDENLFPLSTAIYKMTGLPAKMLGLEDRGRIADGMIADLTIFDYEKIEDRSTIQNPHRYPSGVEYVVVNGKIAMERGDILPIRDGRILRHGR